MVSDGLGERPPLTRRVKGLYGLGSVSTGLVTRSLSAFMLLFYSQVLGVPAAQVAGVIALVTLFDTVMDPIVGQVSDNFRSRLGRRHPFMYAGAIPTGAAFALLWMPPAGFSHDQLLTWLLVCLLALRFSDTLFELPSISLAPELTAQYEERSVLIALRKGFEMAGGYLFVMAGYEIFMRETPDGGGLTVRDGYMSYGLVGGLLIVLVVIASALGTRKFVPWLVGPPARKISPQVFVREAGQTLNSPPLWIMAMAGMLYSTAVGLTQSLSIYFNLFFWQLSQAQVALLATVQIPASFLAVALAPLLVKRFGKKAVTIVPTLIGLALTISPVTLRLMGIMPPNGHPIIYPLLLTEAVLGQIFLLIGVATMPAMLADVVEDVEVRTGRRAEGLIFSFENLARKFVSGFGVLIAGLALTFVAFPRQAKPGTVDAEPLLQLGMVWAGGISFFLCASMVCIALFPIDKRRHEANLRWLAEAKA